MWTYCIDRNVWLTTVHIPGKENNTPDYLMRLLHENIEWKLFPTIFKKPETHFTSKNIIGLFPSFFN